MGLGRSGDRARGRRSGNGGLERATRAREKSSSFGRTGIFTSPGVQTRCAMAGERAVAAAAGGDGRTPTGRTGIRSRPTAARPRRPAGERESRIGAAAAQEFRAADADGNGFLSRDEVRRFPVLARDFERTDADGDGRISMQEFVRLRRLQAHDRSQE